MEPWKAAADDDDAFRRRRRYRISLFARRFRVTVVDKKLGDFLNLFVSNFL